MLQNLNSVFCTKIFLFVTDVLWFPKILGKSQPYPDVALNLSLPLESYPRTCFLDKGWNYVTEGFSISDLRSEFQPILPKHHPWTQGSSLRIHLLKEFFFWQSFSKLKKLIKSHHLIDFTQLLQDYFRITPAENLSRVHHFINIKLSSICYTFHSLPYNRLIEQNNTNQTNSRIRWLWIEWRKKK